MKPDKDPRSISRRKFLRTGAAAASGLALAACGGGGTQTGGTGDAAGGATASGATGSATAGGGQTAGGAGQTNLTVWYWDDSIKPAIDAFHQTQDRIRVRFEKLSYDDTHKKLLTSLAAGSGAPDVVAIELGYIGSFAAKGGLTDLLQAPFDAGQVKNDMVEYKWTQATSPDGRLIAMPWDIGPGGLWYRADLFEQAGLETDPEKVQARVKTWDDWFQLGEDLKKKLPDTALVADAFNDIMNPMVQQQGHGWIENNKLLFEEKGLQPLQRAADARQRGIDANIDWWGAEWATGVKKNAFAGMGIACWMQSGLTREQPQTVGQWRVIRAPGGDFNMGGSFLSIPEQTQNKEAAWEFVRFVCATTEGQNTIFKASGVFPAYKPAWNDPIYDQPVEFFGGQKAFRLWLDAAAGVPGNIVHPGDRQASDILGAEVTKVEKEGKDPAQAVRDAEAEAVQRIRDIQS